MICQITTVRLHAMQLAVGMTYFLLDRIVPITCILVEEQLLLHIFVDDREISRENVSCSYGALIEAHAPLEFAMAILVCKGQCRTCGVTKTAGDRIKTEIKSYNRMKIHYTFAV